MNNRWPYVKPEIWGGMECTINRTQNGYRDQLAEIGYYERPGDLQEICKLGFKKIRFPILWERHYPVDEKAVEWERTAAQLAMLRASHIEPIAGLLHHGSGPADTDLLDPEFPYKLAAYAKTVAERFPWITYYTPVNEPLTTARFSGLYGFWYPHKKNDGDFLRMLLNQVKGVVLAMQEIRKINPKAVLVQTEDIAKTYSTPELSYQADFDNARRWWTYDLLMGKINEQHPSWSYFQYHGVTSEEIGFFAANPCPPGVAGFNYYVTSERFLDERIEKYPAHTHGGNGLHKYADVAAVRSGHSRGAAHLLREAWNRYGIPLAITECQLQCTREQQMRWFYQHVCIAEQICHEGIPVVAVTAWSLVGALDWDTLLCEQNQRYENGVFIVENSVMRPSAMARMLADLAHGNDCFHPALDGAGWWTPEEPRAFAQPPVFRSGSGKILIVLGCDTEAGKMLCNLCIERKLLFHPVSVSTENLSRNLRESQGSYTPWAVIDAAYIVEEDDHVSAGSIRTYPDSQTVQWLSFTVVGIHAYAEGKDYPTIDYSIAMCPRIDSCHQDEVGSRARRSLQNHSTHPFHDTLFTTRDSRIEQFNSALDQLIDRAAEV